MFKEWFKNLLCIDEKRYSTIATVLILFCIFAGYQIFTLKSHDVPSNTKFIICTAMGLIASVNGINSWVNNSGKIDDTQDKEVGV